jgi:hypothetical protein
VIRPSRVAHLAARFFASLHPRPLDAPTLAWVTGVLAPGELHVWEGLGAADRAESVAVARRVEAALEASDASDPAWIAAALLHDVGKQASAYGPFGRAVATLVTGVAGADAVRAWAEEPSRVKGRLGRYAAHDEVGGDLLRLAGARAEAAAWADAHHRPDHWDSTGIPPGVCRALARADGEALP